MKLTALSAVFVSSIAVALLPACSSAHGGDGNDITAVNESVRTSPGQTYGTLTTVNGDVRIARGTGADEARTVNGDVELDDDARIGTARTVNGSLRRDGCCDREGGPDSQRRRVTRRARTRRR